MMDPMDALPSEHRDRIRSTAMLHQVKESIHQSVSDSIKQEVERVIDAIAQDMRTDREVASAIRELVQTLSRPIQRTCTLQLSTGPVTLTVHEQRL